MCIYTPIPITESIIQNFKPARLAIKKINDIYYFCKSIRKDIYKYPGSGTLWKTLIKKHGKENIQTLWVSDWYYDPREIQEVALHFSKENQIVESKTWANLKPETGLDGGAVGVPNVYIWHNIKTNCIEVMTAPELSKKYKVAVSRLYKVVSGHIEMARNWTIYGTEITNNDPKKGPKKDETIYEWIHLPTGTRKLSCRSDMIKQYELKHSNISKMISGRSGFKTVKGWKIINT